MKRFLVLLLLLPLAAAGPGHGDPVPNPTALYMHWGDKDQGALHATVPTVHTAPDAPDLSAESCEQASWDLIFTQDDPSNGIEWSDGLARDAPMSGSTRVLFFFETVGPTGEPLATPIRDVLMNVTIAAGDDPTSLAGGQVLATGGATITPVAFDDVPGRSIYRAELKAIAWEGNSTIKAPDGFHMTIQLGQDILGCPSGFGLRPYSDDLHTSVWTGKVFAAIGVDFLEAGFGDELYVNGTISSPWGSSNIIVDQMRIQGPLGPITNFTVVSADTDGAVAMKWKWNLTGAPYGSYRVDWSGRDVAGNEVDDFFTLQRDQPVVNTGTETETQDEGKESPGVGLVALLGVLALALRRK